MMQARRETSAQIGIVVSCTCTIPNSSPDSWVPPSRPGSGTSCARYGTGQVNIQASAARGASPALILPGMLTNSAQVPRPGLDSWSDFLVWSIKPTGGKPTRPYSGHFRVPDLVRFRLCPDQSRHLPAHLGSVLAIASFCHEGPAAQRGLIDPTG